MLVEHEIIYDDILEAWLLEQKRTDRVKRVKPAARLVHAFGDEVGRERVFEDLLVFKWVMPLRERHRSGIEPNVDEFGNAAHFAAAETLQRYIIDVRLVKIERFRQFRAFLAKFVNAADRPLTITRLANPDGQGRSPISVA